MMEQTLNSSTCRSRPASQRCKPVLDKHGQFLRLSRTGKVAIYFPNRLDWVQMIDGYKA